jgi:FMN phosphatase YigB (HAD superfamily)
MEGYGMSKIATLILGVVVSMSHFMRPANICFDLGGVLLKTAKMKAAQAIGMNYCMSYMMYRSTKMEPEEFLYHILRQINPGDHNKTGVFSGDQEIPTLGCQWLQGVRANAELLREIEQAIDANPDLFANKSERHLIEHLIAYMMTPEKFVPTISINTEGLNLLNACYNEKDLKGKRKHKLYVVSNWDAESFEQLLKREDMQELWAMFDGVYVSGQLKLLKPHDGFYMELKKTMTPEEELCIFIDDQIENRQHAQKHGFYALDGKRPKHAKQRLKKMGVLS